MAIQLSTQQAYEVQEKLKKLPEEVRVEATTGSIIQIIKAANEVEAEHAEVGI